MLTLNELFAFLIATWIPFYGAEMCEKHGANNLLRLTVVL